MKKIIYPLLLFSLLLLPFSLGASEPVLINSFEPTLPVDANTPTTEYAQQYALWDDFVAIPYWYEGSSNEDLGFDIWNWRTETLVFRSTPISSCANPSYAGITKNSVKYWNGYLIHSLGASSSASCNGFVNNKNVYQVFDVSNLGFIDLEASIGKTGGVGVDDTQVEVIFRDGSNFYFQTRDNDAQNTKWYFNQTAIIESPSVMPSFTTIDLVNEVMGRGTTLYSSFDDGEPIYNVSEGTIAVGRGTSFTDWNRNSVNPEYVTNLGYLVITGGDYSNVQTSTSSQLPYTPLFFFERENILGYNGTLGVDAKWAYSNVSTLTAPVHTISNTLIPGNQLYRDDTYNNQLMVVNNSDFNNPIIYVYETEEIDFFNFLPEEANTPPSQALEFLGVDISNRFIFKNTVSDGQGGRVYQAQAVDFTYTDFFDLLVTEIIGYDNNGDLSLVADSGVTNTISLLTSQPAEHSGTDFGSNSLEWNINQDGVLFLRLRTPFTPLETNYTGTALVWSLDALSVFATNERSINLVYVDTQAKIITEFYIQRYDNNDTAYIYERDGLTDTFLGELSLTGEEDYFRFLNNINFTSKEVEVIIATLNDSLATTRPFLDNDSYGFSGVAFGDSITGFGDFRLRVDSLGLEYILNAPRYPDYELIDLFDAEETQIFASAVGGGSGFGAYTLYSFVTDDTLGTEDYSNLLTLNFVYDNSTAVLDQQTINDIISDAQETLIDNEGFGSLDFIEGDLISDSFMGLLDGFNIKSTASKFLVGLILIFIAIAVGANLANNSNSSAGNTIGAIVGAVIGLFLVTYWGFFPIWISFVVALVVLFVGASIIRNGLTGNRGV